MGSSNERMILLSHHGRRNQTVSRGTPRSRRLIPEPEPAQQQKKKRDKNTNQTRQTRKETEEGGLQKSVPVLEGESKHPPPPHLYAPHNPLSLPQQYISTLSPWKTIIN